jgi:membrane protein DedA with SNARE-associated domain
MKDWIVHIIESSGYAGIALLMFLENVFPPIPSEL